VLDHTDMDTALTEFHGDSKRRTNFQRVTQIFLIAGVAAVTGCTTHIHDQARQALADKARIQTAELIKAEQQAFDVMASNLAVMSANEEATFKRLDADVVAAQTRIVSRKKWGELRSEATIEPGGSSKLTGELEARVSSLVSAITKELVSADATRGKAKDSLDAANAELDQARAKATRWNKQIAVLEKIIELTPSAVTATNSPFRAIKNLDDFSARISEIAKLGKDTKITYFDADGNSITNDFSSSIEGLADPDRKSVV